MKVLIIGSGGRESALAWKVSQSAKVSEVICLPGNGGRYPKTRNHPLSASDLTKCRDFALAEKVDLTIVGPDEALANGVVELFQASGLKIFGPSSAAARLESSKIFAKGFMERHGIPTARSSHFSDATAAQEYARKLGCPIVIKADGLALGKGVIIAETHREAAMAIHRMMDRREFGGSGTSVVIEEFLVGSECSIHALVDGKSYLLFPPAQDHKRAFDGDAGPNTGGMGTCSPVASFDAAMQERVRHEIMDRFMAGIEADQIDFRGMLFPGLMITGEGPKVLEFNCRFGDPETQVFLPRLCSDLVDLLEATIDGNLADARPVWSDQAAVCVVMASGGYPGNYHTGFPITGILEAEREGAIVFPAGTKRERETLLTAGGRVLGVTALGENVEMARKRAYQAVAEIEFADKFFRNDIGLKQSPNPGAKPS